VIADVMRSGPSTGMPTKQEQGDLNQLLYGGHGEIPRFVIAPTTIAECFDRTVEAFNLAERYQVPVFLVADLSMAVTERTYPPERFDMESVEIDRGKVAGPGSAEDVADWTDAEGHFQPHAVTSDGISPRAFPGTADAAHMTTGLEHDERGHRTEAEDERVAQVDKRQRKVETAREREDLDWRAFGDPGADTLVVSWGSNEGALREALPEIESRGIDVRILTVPSLFPRPDLTGPIEAAEQTIVVECNATGQFADVIERDALERVDRINKYTGVRFTADELADRIVETVEAQP